MTISLQVSPFNFKFLNNYVELIDLLLACEGVKLYRIDEHNM